MGTSRSNQEIIPKSSSAVAIMRPEKLPKCRCCHLLPLLPAAKRMLNGARVFILGDKRMLHGRRNLTLCPPPIGPALAGLLGDKPKDASGRRSSEPTRRTDPNATQTLAMLPVLMLRRPNTVPGSETWALQTCVPWPAAALAKHGRDAQRHLRRTHN
jgi:hypothetical protein